MARSVHSPIVILASQPLVSSSCLSVSVTAAILCDAELGSFLDPSDKLNVTLQPTNHPTSGSLKAKS